MEIEKVKKGTEEPVKSGRNIPHGMSAGQKTGGVKKNGNNGNEVGRDRGSDWKVYLSGRLGEIRNKAHEI